MEFSNRGLDGLRHGVASSIAEIVASMANTARAHDRTTLILFKDTQFDEAFVSDVNLDIPLLNEDISWFFESLHYDLRSYSNSDAAPLAGPWGKMLVMSSGHEIVLELAPVSTSGSKVKPRVAIEFSY